MTGKQLQRYERAKLAYAALMKFYPMTLDNIDGEEWCNIGGYVGYQVSNYGRVKSFRLRNTRIIKPQPNGQGYLMVCLRGGAHSNFVNVHRLVAEAFIPNTENKREVNHKDGHKLNNYVDNLEWVTSSENRQHAFNMGLQLQGGERSDAYLTNEQVEWCREVYKPRDKEFSAASLARKLNVPTYVILLAIHGQTYKNAGGQFHKRRGVPEEIKSKIRAEYVRGSTEFGTVALAKKYGLTQSLVWIIVNEK